MNEHLGTGMAIETSRLILEPLRVEHAELCFGHLADPELYVYVPQNPPASIEKLAERYRHILTNAPANQIWLNWFGRAKKDDAFVCSVQATIDIAERSAMLAYQTFAPNRQQGLAREACIAVMDHLVSRRHLVRFVAEIDTLNVASRKLLESLHFRQVGLKRNADHFKGRSSDEFIYELQVKR